MIYRYWKATFLRVRETIIIIQDPSETFWRPIRHARSETSTCFIRDWHTSSETHCRPSHATLETNMPDWRHIEDLYMLYLKPTCPIGNLLDTDMPVSLRWSMLRSLMGLRSGMLVSNGSSMKHVEVSDQACWGLLKHVEVSNGSLIGLWLVTD